MAGRLAGSEEVGTQTGRHRGIEEGEEAHVQACTGFRPALRPPRRWVLVFDKKTTVREGGRERGRDGWRERERDRDRNGG